MAEFCQQPSQPANKEKGSLDDGCAVGFMAPRLLNSGIRNGYQDANSRKEEARILFTSKKS